MASGNIPMPDADETYKKGETITNAWCYAFAVTAASNTRLSAIAFLPKKIRNLTFTPTSTQLYIRDVSGEFVLGNRYELISKLDSCRKNSDDSLSISWLDSNGFSVTGNIAIGQVVISGTFS